MAENTYYLPRWKSFIPHSFKSLKFSRNHLTGEEQHSLRGFSTRTINDRDHLDLRFTQHRSVRSNSGTLSKHQNALQKVSSSQMSNLMNPFQKKRNVQQTQSPYSQPREGTRSAYTPGTKPRQKFIFPTEPDPPSESISELLARKGFVPISPVKSMAKSPNKLKSHAEFQAEHRQAFRAMTVPSEDLQDPYLWRIPVPHSYKHSAGAWSGMSGSHASQESRAVVSFEKGFQSKIRKPSYHSEQAHILSRPIVPAETIWENQAQSLKIQVPAKLKFVKVPTIQILGSKPIPAKQRSSAKEEITFREVRGSVKPKQEWNLIPLRDEPSRSRSGISEEEIKTVERFESAEHVASREDPDEFGAVNQMLKSRQSSRSLTEYIPPQPNTLLHLNFEPLLPIQAISPKSTFELKPSPTKMSAVSKQAARAFQSGGATTKHPLQRANTTTLTVPSAVRLGIVSPPSRQSKPVLGKKDTLVLPGENSTTRDKKETKKASFLKKAPTVGTQQLEKIELKNSKQRPVSPGINASRLMQSTSTGYRLTGHKPGDSVDNSGVVIDPKPLWLEDQLNTPNGGRPSPFLYTIPESRFPESQVSIPLGGILGPFASQSQSNKQPAKQHSKLLYEFDSSDQEAQDLNVGSFIVQQK